MNVVIFGIILSCFAAVGVWLIWSTARLIDRMPPYRRVLRRYPADDAEGGEIIELECGHGLRLVLSGAVGIPPTGYSAPGDSRYASLPVSPLTSECCRGKESLHRRDAENAEREAQRRQFAAERRRKRGLQYLGGYSIPRCRGVARGEA